MKPTNMLLSKVRNTGFVKRTTFINDNETERRLARVMSQRAGLPGLDSTIQELLEAGLQEETGAEAEAIPFTMTEYTTLHGDRLDGFSDLISPSTPEDFFQQQHRGRLPLLFRGPDERFLELMRWEDLDELLRHRNLKFPQLKFVVDGQAIPPTDFIGNYYGLGTHNYKEPYSRINEHNLLQYLRNGATLIIDGVWAVHAPINRFIAAISADLGTNAIANLYVSWRNIIGFAPHWDAHNVFIVQIRGSKVWRLYGENRVAPTSIDVEPNLDCPAQVIWEGKLNAGDVLYIPRGWWHDAAVPQESDGEGSIHLTIQIHRYTGAHVLDWLGSRIAASSEVFRMDVPWTADSETLRSYFGQLRNLIIEALDSNLEKEFMDDIRRAWSEDPEIHLGRRIEPWTDDKWDDYLLGLRGREQAVFREGSGGNTFKLAANGYTCEFHRNCFELLNAIMKRGETRVSELKSLDPARFSAQFINDFLIQLVKEDIVVARPPHVGASTLSS